MMNRPKKKTSCLHLVTRSSADVIEHCRTFSEEQDEVLFLDDGVMCLVNERRKPGDTGIANCIFLGADLEARGLMEIARELNVRTIQDQDFAGLLRKHENCLTWK
jgi:sulfur relay protein TusB/DsrH